MKLRDPPYEGYGRDIERGRVAIEEEQEANSARTLPIFVPGYNVSEGCKYGWTLSQECGALTEGELVAATNKTPAALGLTPWQACWSAPGQKQNLFLVSLRDLPEELRHSVRKVTTWHSVEASRDKLQLTPTTMLSAHQHHSAFEHVSNNVKSIRPPMMGSLFTIPELKDLAARVDTELAERGLVEVQGEGEKPEKPKLLAGLEVQAPEVKKRKRGTGPRSVPMIAAAGAGGGNDEPAAPLADAEDASTVRSGDRSTSKTTSKGKMLPADLEALDADMKRVANLHLSAANNRNASARCLLQLNVDNFMQKASNPEKGQALSSAAWYCRCFAGGDGGGLGEWVVV